LDKIKQLSFLILFGWMSQNGAMAAPSLNWAQAVADLVAAQPALRALHYWQQIQREFEHDFLSISGPDSTLCEPFLGLKEGNCDQTKEGPIYRLQRALLKWNEKMPLQATGIYNEATVRFVLLFKLAYDLGENGDHIDAATAERLTALEHGQEEGDALGEPRSVPGRLIYEASKFLGIRYRLGGDGKKTTDCGMLTRNAMIAAGFAENFFNRVAATQYRYAENGDMGMVLLAKGEDPSPGDLVFFKWNIRRARYRYKGITHVGIFLGRKDDNFYVLEAVSRRERKVTVIDRSRSMHGIVGFARVVGPANLAKGSPSQG
jgi:hypothetical protein